MNIKYGNTEVILCRDADEMGRTTADLVSTVMRSLLSKQAEVRIVLAAAESQVPFLDALAIQPGIAWNRVVCFNMDDLWDPGMSAQLSCGAITLKHLYKKVCPKAFHLVKHNALDPEEEALRFEALLRSCAPLDITCQGIGRSGHIALNEPDCVDFRDQRWVRVVDIAETSKQQLLDDPNFRALGHIPAQGITMTLTALFSARQVYTIVPFASKRPILTKLFNTQVPTPGLPASILSERQGLLLIDRESCPAELLSKFDAPVDSIAVTNPE